MPAVQQLDPSVTGNLGLLVDDDTAILLQLAEVDGIAPSDAAGTLDDLAPDTAAAPDVVTTHAWAQTITRDFTGGGLIAADQAPTSALTRDVSIQAICTLPDDGTDRATLIARGLGAGPAAERVAFGLELAIVAGATRSLRLFWETPAGLEVIDAGASFTHPGTDAILLITATRRWEAADRVVCRYYIGDQLIGESVAANGAIGGGLTGHTTIGCRKVSIFERRWAATIDELKVTRHEMAPEEVAATWRRLSLHQPAGVEVVRDMVPAGAPITSDPTSRVQRLLRLIGQALGFALARTEQLDDVLPDRAYGPILARWEAIAGLSPGPLDSLELRRTRLVAHLRRKGWTIANVRDALYELLDLAPADIELLNFSNTYTDDFTSVRPERWLAEPTTLLYWTTIGGALRVQAGFANDIRWTGQVRLAPICRMSIHNPVSVYFAAKVSAVALPTDGEAGLYLGHGYNGGHLFFGMRNNGGVVELVYQRFRAGAAVDVAPVVLPAGASADNWLRVRGQTGSFIGGADDMQLTLEWSTDGVTFASLEDLIWTSGWRWLGFYARGSDNSLAGALDVRFAEFLCRTPRGTRPFCVYAMRDPLLPGDPDMAGARALLRRFRHAYVHASAITSRSLLCDDSASGCDAGPMGGF